MKATRSYPIPRSPGATQGSRGARAVMDDSRPVGEIMTRNVVKVLPEARLIEAARLMRGFHVSGLPVVQADGTLAGVLSEKDLVRDLHRAAGVGSPRGLLDLLLDSSSGKGPTVFELCRRRLEKGHVADLMATRIVTVRPTTPIRELAELMEREGVHRLPVIDDQGALVGIVSRRDVVAAVAGVAPSAGRGALRPGPTGRTPRREGEDPFADA
jgi:CBS domain-containing protein